MAKTAAQRDRLLPKAARVFHETGSVNEAARAVKRHRGTVARWMKLPAWEAELERLEGERRALLAELDEERRRQARERVREVEEYRDEAWGLAQKIHAKGLEILDNKVAPKRVSTGKSVTVARDKAGKEIIDEATGKPKLIDRTEKTEGQDSAAQFAAKMLTGSGFRGLLDIAYGRPVVEQPRAGAESTPEERDDRRIEIARERAELIERAKAAAAAAEA